MCCHGSTEYLQTADCLTDDRVEGLVMYYSETEARRLVKEAGLRLLENKLVARTWGNISARIGEGQFVITPSGKFYEDLTESDMVVVNIDDCSWEGDRKPSSEKGVHADAYALRSDVSFIIHTHQTYASAVAAECRDTVFAPCARYGLPGTSKLRKNMKACIGSHPADKSFLMARHGALLLGSSPDEAFDLANRLEENSRALVEKRVPSHDSVYDADIDAAAVASDVFPCVITCKDPYIMECCRAGLTLGSYLDDFAQIVGPDMQVVSGDESVIKRTLLGYSAAPVTFGPVGRLPMTGALDRMGGTHESLNAAIGRNAVLVKGVGAVCAGKTEADAEAVASIVRKNCIAACYVRHTRPMRALDARLQRYVYLTKYSKKAGS